MNRRVVEGIGAAFDAQEAGALRIRCGAETADMAELFSAAERAVGIAVGDDVARCRSGEAGNML